MFFSQHLFRPFFFNLSAICRLFRPILSFEFYGISVWQHLGICAGTFRDIFTWVFELYCAEWYTVCAVFACHTHLLKMEKKILCSNLCLTGSVYTNRILWHNKEASFSFMFSLQKCDVETWTLCCTCGITFHRSRRNICIFLNSYWRKNWISY